MTAWHWSRARRCRRAFAPSIHCRQPVRACVFAALVQFVSSIAIGAEITLPEVTVQEKRMQERADGPVVGYRATRSSTFTKTDTPLMEVPASVTVVPGDLMRDQEAESLADALRYVPGIMMHQGEGNRDQFILRGNSTTADFFVNGIRDDAQVFRDPNNLVRVEVLKGPGGMIFGRGGARGVINRVTKRPVFERLVAGDLTVGTYEHFRGTGDFGNTLGETLAWRLNVLGEISESFRHGVDYRRYAVNPSMTYVWSPQTSLTLTYEHLYDARTADRGIPSHNGGPFETPRSRFFGNAEQSNAESTFDSVSAVLTHDFGRAQLTNSFRTTYYDKYYHSTLAIQESTLCRPGKGEQALAGN
jgi:catecholate siderophore receptor